MSKSLIYTGIGSRETPQAVLEVMFNIAMDLAPNWLLRSGHADGADQAFERGCIQGNGQMEIYIPWNGFNSAPNNHPQYIRRKATQELADFSAQFHPAWNKCSDAAKLMHMRNACQILGQDGQTPADLIICWTKDGKRGGGTGQALRIAEHYNIPIFDLALADDHLIQHLCAYMEKLEGK